MKELLYFQLQNLRSNVGVAEVDMMSQYINDMNVVEVGAKMLESLGGICGTDIYIETNNKDAVKFLYSLVVSEFTDKMAIAVYNAMVSNKDWIMQYFYENETPTIKALMKDDIESFKKSANIEDFYIVGMFNLNAFINHILTEDGIFHYYGASDRADIERYIHFENENFDSMILKRLYQNVTCSEMLNKIIVKVNNLILKQNKVTIQNSELFSYFYKWASIK